VNSKFLKIIQVCAENNIHKISGSACTVKNKMKCTDVGLKFVWASIIVNDVDYFKLKQLKLNSSSD